MSDTYIVERSASIAASPADVYGHIIDLHEMERWSPWDRLDPNVSRTYSGPDSGVGSRYEWSGNRKVGEGSMEITGAEENSRVDWI